MYLYNCYLMKNNIPINETFLTKKTSRSTNDKLISDSKYPYYCSLCGSLSLISTSVFDSLPRRHTDDSIICVLDKVSIENFLNQGKLIIIHRGNNKYEKQFTYTCKNCGTFIAYQSTEFENENGYHYGQGKVLHFRESRLQPFCMQSGKRALRQN